MLKTVKPNTQYARIAVTFTFHDFNPLQSVCPVDVGVCMLHNHSQTRHIITTQFLTWRDPCMPDLKILLSHENDCEICPSTRKKKKTERPKQRKCGRNFVWEDTGIEDCLFSKENQRYNAKK